MNQNTDARCDIYAVGATFYHLLTNRTPIDSAKRSLNIWEGDKDSLPNPSELNADIPPTISAWLLKALEIERENRFASALEMQKSLQTAIEEAKTEHKTSEKTLILPESQISSDNDEGRKITAQRLMQAKTENLIEEKPSQIKTEKKIILDTQASQTQSSHAEPSITQTPLPEPPVTESLPFEISHTSSSGSVSKSELTGNAYFDEKLIEEKKPEPAPIPLVEPKTKSKSGFNIFWLLPIFAFGLLAIGGIGGGIVWLNSSNSADTKKSVSNTGISTPTATQAISPTVSPTVALSVSPTTSPAQSVSDNEKPKPTVAPTTDKTPLIQNPVKTPTAQKTPTSKPTKTPNLSDDCVYNGKCK